MSGGTIDVRQIDVSVLRERRFPGASSLRLSIERGAYDTAWRQAIDSVKDARKAGQQPLEVGGVLLGNLWRDDDGPFLEIVAAIPAQHTRNQGTQMTFTPETWAELNRIKDESYPDTKMVGWYHTHPNFGIFLSEMDHMIHRRGFSQPWATALVLDPVREKEGFFLWVDGEPRLAPEYWVGGERRDRSWVGLTAMQELLPLETASSNPSKVVSQASFMVATLVNLLVLALLCGYIFMSESRHRETERFVLAGLEAQKTDLQVNLGALDGLRREMENSRMEARNRKVELDRTIGRLRVGLAQNARAIAFLRENIVGGPVTAGPDAVKKK
jgi:proteasome lid subunit RPN8/RPN11